MALVQAQDHSGSRRAIALTEARTARAFALARRHSRLVRVLRVLLPLGSLAAIVSLGLLTLFRNFDTHIAGMIIGEMSIDGTKVTMGSPRLTGGRMDGSGYVINAEKAIQDVTQPSDVELFHIDGDIGQKDQPPLKLTATAGHYNTATEKLQLSGVVRLENTSYTVDLKSADVDFKAGVYATREQINVVGSTGVTIQADSATAQDNATKLTFVGHVKTEIPPQDSAGEQAAHMKSESQ